MGLKRVAHLVGAGLLALCLAGLTLTPASATCYFLECDGAPAPAPAPAPPEAPRQPAPAMRSYWNHNGSVMYLVANGNQREFYYYKPRLGMVEEGVGPGTLLFTGTVRGNAYEGTAYLFSARCGKRGYHVSGPVAESGGRVVMTGAALSLGRSCKPRKVFNDVLVFDYLYQN